MPFGRGIRDGSIPAGVDALRIGAVLQQHAHDVEMAVHRRRHQRRSSLLVLDVGIGLVLDEQPGGFRVAAECCGHQRARPVAGRGSGVGPGGQQEMKKIETAG